MSFPRQHIAIIGAGPAGLCLALHLTKYNIKSTIYESRDAAYAHGGEIALAPNALRALDHIGAYEPLAKHGFNSEFFTVVNRRGNFIGTMPHGSRFGMPQVRLRRTFVRDVLLESCRANEVEIVYGKKIVKLDEGEGKVSMHFEGGDIVTADLVIGADGLRSIVRHYIDPKPKPIYTGTTIMYGCIPISVLLENMKDKEHTIPEPSMTFSKEGTFTIWPRDYAGQEVGFFANMEVPDKGREGWKEFAADMDRMRQILEKAFCQDGWPEKIQAMCRHADELRPVPVNMLQPLLDSWSSSSGKVIVIGDAAHAISPSGGQGGAMAFEDAETLAYAISKSEQNPNALKEWEAHRQARLQQVIDFNNLTIKVRQASNYAAIQWLKELFLWSLFKVKGPDGFRWLYGYDGAAEMEKLLGEVQSK